MHIKGTTLKLRQKIRKIFKNFGGRGPLGPKKSLKVADSGGGKQYRFERGDSGLQNAHRESSQ